MSWESGPFLALGGLDGRAFQIDQALEVVASGHHGHGKVGAGLADDAHRLPSIWTMVPNTCSARAGVLAMRRLRPSWQSER